jgi:2-dehydropantoate 2-reductase
MPPNSTEALYRLSLFGKVLPGRTKHHHFKQFSYISDPATLSQQSYDYILNTVSSTALRSGWWEAFSDATGDAYVVSLQPALDDAEFILETLPKERFIKGFIQFFSYQSPLPGSNAPAGVHYLLPPVAGLFENESGSTTELIQALKSGGFNAQQRENLNFFSSSLSSITIPITAALELSDWKISTLVKHENLQLGLDASREANRAIALTLGGKPVSSRLLKEWLARLVLRAAPFVSPFDVEAYLKFHFSKVGEQTRLMLEQFIAHAKEHDLPHAANSRLLDALYQIDERGTGSE